MVELTLMVELMTLCGCLLFSKIGEDQSPEDAEDGPPELLVMCCLSTCLLVCMLELKHRHACVRKIQYEGVCREANTAQGKAKCCFCLETPPKYCIFRTRKQGGALSDNYIVLPGHVWLGMIFSSTQTAAIFGDKDINKCSYNLFRVVERTNRISLASFSNLQCHTHDQSCCLSGVVFKSFVIRRSVSVYTIYS